MPKPPPPSAPGRRDAMRGDRVPAVKRATAILRFLGDHDEPMGVQAVARVLVARRVDAAIATNTTIARDAVASLPHGNEAGGLSGRPVFERSNAVVRTLAKALDGALPIIGVGGILSGGDAREKIASGASLVQIYTGLVYRGPSLAAECVRALAAMGSAMGSEP